MCVDVVRRWMSSKCALKLGFVLRQERILGHTCMSYFPIDPVHNVKPLKFYLHVVFSPSEHVTTPFMGG